MPEDLPGSLELGHFRPLVGETFQVAARDLTVPLELTDASALPGQPSQPRDPFRLEFRGPVAAPVPQGTYRFSHAALGSLDIFLVPIGRSERGLTYEAIFN